MLKIMATDLFSALDCNLIAFSFLLWLAPITLMFLFSSLFKRKGHFTTLRNLISGVHAETRSEMSPTVLFLYSLIIFIISINLIGITPYVYGITRNL